MRLIPLGRCALTAMTVAVTANAAWTQTPAKTMPDSLPRELVEALLRPYLSTSPGTTEYYIGRVPAAMERLFYVPSGARVLGGMASPSGFTTVLRTSMSPDELIAAYERELPKLGWTIPTETSDYRGWGFASAVRHMNWNGGGVEFCLISQSLSLTPIRDDRSTLLVATVGGPGGRCGFRAGFNQGRQQAPPGMPTLINPAGTLTGITSCSTPQAMYTSGNGTAERVQTPLQPAQLLDVFGRQLADSGWSPAGSVQQVVRRTWTRADSGNVTRDVTVIVTPLANAGCFDVNMTVQGKLTPAIRK